MSLTSFFPPAGFMHSNENFDATPTTGADAIAPDETDTLASAVSEINNDEADIAGGNDQIDAASVTADGLETISEQVAEANEGDGLDETAAAVIEASVECMLKVARIGVKFKSLGIPSSESFKVKGNRLALGKATCEALADTAKKIWKQIIEAIKKSIEWVRNLFNKIFGAAERIQRRAKALKEKVTTLADKAEETQIENESLYNSVLIKGNVAKAADINNLAKEAKTIFAAQKKFTDDYAKMELDASTSPSTISPSDYGLKAADSNIAKRVTSESSMGVSVTSRFPGDTVVYMVLPKSQSGSTGKDAAEHANSIKAGSVSLAEKKVEGKALPVMPKNDITAMAESVDKFAGEIIAYKQNLTAITADKNKFIGKLEKHLSKGDGRDEADSKDEAGKKAKALATMFRKMMDEPAASFASHSVRGASAVLQYAELSARQYPAR